MEFGEPAGASEPSCEAFVLRRLRKVEALSATRFCSCSLISLQGDGGEFKAGNHLLKRLHSARCLEGRGASLLLLYVRRTLLAHMTCQMSRELCQVDYLS